MSSRTGGAAPISARPGRSGKSARKSPRLRKAPKPRKASKAKKEAKLRRGWRERVEPGLYRNHRVGCRATFSRQPGIRCECPFQAHLPTDVPGRTYPQNLDAQTLRDAREEKARRQKQGRRRGRGNTATVSEFFWDTFMEKQPLRPATRKNYVRIFRFLHEPVIGDINLAALNEEHIADLIRHLDRCAQRRREETGKRNAAWIAQQLIPLQSALSAAVRWRRIPENPLRRPTLPDCPPKRDGETDIREDPKAILSKDQIEELYQAARTGRGSRKVGERDASMFQVAYEFGLRNSEARGLRWGDILFDERRINVMRQIDSVTGEESQTKGKRSRQPPGGDRVFAVLERWHWVSVVRGDADPEGYLWYGAKPGQPMPIGLPNRRIQVAQVRAGFVDPGGRPLIVFHGLRHSRASHLLLDGVPMLEVSRFLGHASQLVTANAYSHLVPDDEFASIRELLGTVRISPNGDSPHDGQLVLA